jgi:hypothetical protein
MRNAIARALLCCVLCLPILPGLAQANPDLAPPAGEDSPPPAIEPAPPVAEPEPTEDILELPGKAQLEGAHTYLSRNVEELSRRIDGFFGAERAFDESSGTYIQTRGSLIFLENGNVDFDGEVRAKLDLPNLKRRISLVIESEEEDAGAQTTGITTGTQSANQTLNNQDLTASLQYVLRQEPTWDLRLQPGIRGVWPPQTFLRLRARLTNPLSERWLSRFTLTPGWFDPRGFEARLRHDFDLASGPGALFRIATEGVWVVKEDRNVEIGQSFFYAHPIHRRSNMAYEVGVLFETDPGFKATAYFSSVRFRRDIHRGWVFLEVKPQVLFPREQDYEIAPSIALSIELLFGAKTMAGKQ